MRNALFLLTVFLSLPVWAEEELAMPQFPGGWIEVYSKHGGEDVAEYVQPGQTAENWQRKIVLDVHHDLKNLPLDALQRRAAGQNREACTGIREGVFQSGVNNGYPSAFWTLGCERDKASGFGETRYSKAIQGATSLYVLTYIWRTPPFIKTSPAISAKDIETAMTFLTTSVVCDNAEPGKFCPK